MAMAKKTTPVPSWIITAVLAAAVVLMIWFLVRK